MVYRSPYPWYFDPPTDGILTPSTHGISTPPTHGISTPLPWYFDPPYFYSRDRQGGQNTYLVIRNKGGQNTMGVQFTIQGGVVFNKGGQYTMDEN